MFVCVEAGKQIEKGGLLQAHKSIEVKQTLETNILLISYTTHRRLKTGQEKGNYLR